MRSWWDNRCLGKAIRLGQLREVIRLLGDPPLPVGAPGDLSRRSQHHTGKRFSVTVQIGRGAGHHEEDRKIAILFVLLAVVTAGCAGLTAREKEALVGGAGGAAGGALFGAAAGNAALGAAIGGPVGLVGGYLLGDRLFKTDPGRK